VLFWLRGIIFRHYTLSDPIAGCSFGSEALSSDTGQCTGGDDGGAKVNKPVFFLLVLRGGIPFALARGFIRKCHCFPLGSDR